MAKAACYLFVILLILPAWAFAQSDADSLHKAKAFIADKKYESAYEVLDNTDPKNQKPEVVLLKEEIALNYFVMSLNHKAFSFVDLEKGQDIMDVRGKQGNSSMHLLPLGDLLDTLIQKYPTNYALRSGLGWYYDEVEDRYKGRWSLSDEEVNRRMIQNYRIAAEHEIQDYHPYYALGLDDLYREQWQEGIPLLRKAIQLAPEFADGHYNLAYAYMQIDSVDGTIWHAKLALDLYKDSSYRADAARMLAGAYVTNKDNNNALRYYLISNALDPGNFYTLKPLLEGYVRTNDPKEIATREEFFKLDPTNPSIYTALEDVYGHSGKLPAYIDFLKSKLPANKKYPTVYGNLNFFLGRAYLSSKAPSDKALALASLIEAKTAFQKVFQKDHPVFVRIQEGIKEAQAKK